MKSQCYEMQSFRMQTSCTADRPTRELVTLELGGMSGKTCSTDHTRIQVMVSIELCILKIKPLPACILIHNIKFNAEFELDKPVVTLQWVTMLRHLYVDYSSMNCVSVDCIGPSLTILA